MSFQAEGRNHELEIAAAGPLPALAYWGVLGAVVGAVVGVVLRKQFRGAVAGALVGLFVAAVDYERRG